MTQTIPFSQLQALVTRAGTNLDGKGLHKFTRGYGQAHGRTTRLPVQIISVANESPGRAHGQVKVGDFP